MKIDKATIKGSPFIGVFASITDEIALVPKSIEKKELKKIQQTLEVEAIKITIGESNLIGALVKGNKKGFLVPESIEEKELSELKEKGLKIKKVKGLNALGNLIALNDFGGIITPLISKKIEKEINDFFKTKLIKTTIAQSEVVGSCLVASNKGFLVHPNVSKKEFQLIKKTLKVGGEISTANYGDPFIANDVLANSNGALVGIYTSGPELIRIDEGLRGD